MVYLDLSKNRIFCHQGKSQRNGHQLYFLLLAFDRFLVEQFRLGVTFAFFFGVSYSNKDMTQFKTQNNLIVQIQFIYEIFFKLLTFGMAYNFSIFCLNMPSSNILSKSKSSNFGGRLVLQQQKNFHNIRLQQIYNRQPKYCHNEEHYYTLTKQKSKKQVFQNKQHEKNIKHLYDFIIRPKTMKDRWKDPHDFFAYPALFFREVPKTKKKTKTRPSTNKIKRYKSQNNLQNHNSQQLSNRKFGIDPQSIKQYLPHIQEFTREEIQEYADAITRIIFNFNLNSKQRLIFLKQCVMQNIPTSYPQDFQQVVEQIFMEIEESIGFN